MCNLFKVDNKDNRTTLIDVVLVALLLTLSIFFLFSSISIADFEHLLFYGGSIHIIFEAFQSDMKNIST